MLDFLIQEMNREQAAN
ncbi:hypothetical protein B9T62_09750 [Paenibacillus donghaensis]|uniref:Uncharacterized protein n=1 Tax=Paenibacillus donghaensis TaxID=414771 RepID=A0A2Z2KZE9_9BACL|nr:hypothetical protein B9T62_09750 [Paenibacillus donghaensis]